MLEDNQPNNEFSRAFVLWCGSGLMALYLALRLIIVLPDISNLSFGEASGAILASAREDIVLILATLFVFALISKSLPDRLHLAIARAFSVVFVVLAAIGLSNLAAVKMLDGPLTLNWVHYADIGSTDIILDSVFHILPIHKLLAGLAIIGVILGLSNLAASKAVSEVFPKGLLVLSAIFLLGGFIQADRSDVLSHGKQRNPLIAFTQSLFSDGGQGSIEKLARTKVTGVETAWPFDRVSGLTLPRLPEIPIRNVIFFAFESTPANQVEGWGGSKPVTPNLKNSLTNALAFDRAYAHVPASNYFLISAFGSLIPELSDISMTYSRPEFDFNALPKVMDAAGFRTGFFNSSDNRFQNTETFVTAVGFSTVKDYRDWTCDTGVYEFTSVSEKYLNTSSDLCTVERIAEWIEEDRDTPFFVAFRTGMTHYPYFPGESPIDFGVEDDNYNNYLNALKVGDQAFGNLLAHLERLGIAEETLVVVAGDHGEAFGAHGTYGHATGIHEVNVHVPMALINPQMFSGTRSDLIVGLRDLAPTITQLMGLETPHSWQGESIFATSRYNGVMFFAPWNGFLIGSRHGNEKLIFNGNSGDMKIFDLQNDPEERINLAHSQPALIEPAMQKLSAMVSAHRAYIDALVAGAPVPGQPDQDVDSVVIAATGTYFGEPPKVWVKLDGEDVGGFTVSGAISNESRTIPESELRSATEKFVLPISSGVSCPKRLEIYFLNDNWAGEGKTGDTDLWVRSVQIGGSIYHGASFRELKERVAHKSGDYYRFSRSGGAYIDLYLDNACLAESLVIDD